MIQFSKLVKCSSEQNINFTKVYPYRNRRTLLINGIVTCYLMPAAGFTQQADSDNPAS